MTLINTVGPDSATGGALCPWGLFEKTDYLNRRRRTDVIIGVIADPVLRETLESFSELLIPTENLRCTFQMALPAPGSWYADLERLARRPVTIWTELSPDASFDVAFRAHTPLAVSAVAYVQRTLGLSLKQTLKAAHIRPRTYHSWQQHPDRNPRLTSQGALWKLRQLTEDLEETMGSVGLRQWFAQDDSRLSALLRGRFDDLSAAAYGTHAGGTAAFDGALDEHESRPRISRLPITGRKANPRDVAGRNA